jgi:hypothetical protein
MVLVSGPLGRFLPAPFRALFPWTNPFEKFAHPHQEAEKSPQAIGAGGRLAVIAPAGSTTGSGPTTGGSGPREPNPGRTTTPPPNGGGSGLRNSVSEQDRRTVALLQQAVDTFGVDQILGGLLPKADMPTALETLVILAGQDRLEDIPDSVTPSQLHAVLEEIRMRLPKLLRKLEKHAEIPSASHRGGRGHKTSKGGSDSDEHPRGRGHLGSKGHSDEHRKNHKDKTDKKDHSGSKHKH